MRPTDLHLPGAVPLDPRPAPGPAAGTGAAGPAVIDVTEATFATEVLDRSSTTPVVLDFWASWCGPCRQLSPVLERLATAAAGAWVLAKIDVDANPRLAQAAGVQGIPAVKAVVDGRVVAEFTGALPEAQVRSWLAGLPAAGGNGPAPAAPPPDPEFERAEAALDRGDLGAAAAAYRSVLDRSPADPDARMGLARVELVRRARGYDPRALRRRSADPLDLDAALAVADLDLLDGDAAGAFDRLVDLVRRSAGADRERVRTHLLGLFDALDPQDPRVLTARRALTSVLF